MKMYLVALAGLAIGFATLLFSGCANGGFTSASGQQQNTLVKSNARGQGTSPSPTWVDWTKDAKSQPALQAEPLNYGVGQP